MPSEAAELLNAVSMTRTVLKGLQRQARAALQLSTDLEERLARYEPELRNRTAEEAQRNGSERDRTAALGR